PGRPPGRLRVGSRRRRTAGARSWRHRQAGQDLVAPGPAPVWFTLIMEARHRGGGRPLALEDPGHDDALDSVAAMTTAERQAPGRAIDPGRRPQADLDEGGPQAFVEDLGIEFVVSPRHLDQGEAAVAWVAEAVALDAVVALDRTHREGGQLDPARGEG